jgi:hypothetical protein
VNNCLQRPSNSESEETKEQIGERYGMAALYGSLVHVE